MDSGTIIFYLIIIVFIITRIRRAMKEGEKSAPEKSVRQSGWKKALSDVVTEIQAAMEPVAESASTPAGQKSGWENITIPTEYPSAEPEELPLMDLGSRAPENLRDLKLSGKMEEIRERIEELRARKSDISTQVAAAPGMPGARGTVLRNPLPRLPDQLQAAVVWSEILAPPLALREIDR